MDTPHADAHSAVDTPESATGAFMGKEKGRRSQSSACWVCACVSVSKWNAEVTYSPLGSTGPNPASMM